MGQTKLKTLLITDLVESTRLVDKLGLEESSSFFSKHDRLTRDLVRKYSGLEIDKSDGFLIVFDRPVQAVLFALFYHQALNELSEKCRVKVRARVGIHVGDIILRQNSPQDIERGAKPIEVEGIAKPLTARLMSLALPSQNLLSRSTFDLARKAKNELEGVPGQIFWQAHGSYLIKGVEEAIDVYEVGLEGMGPRVAPTSTHIGTRISTDDTIRGWRPAPGLVIPQRRQWELVSRLGLSGFGEVWLAEHIKTKEKRVYKFCFEVERLRALKREVTIFRVIKENLGNRDDIVKIMEWNFEEQPYFLELEYAEGGNLIEWYERQGGVKQVPLEVRLEIVAKIADGLAAAHSVGVLHKDIKPSNILINETGKLPEIRLADFGIGKITDKGQLENLQITALGLTELHLEADRPSYSGTRLYMAPEILEGRIATVQSDIYALGVLLFQVIVGDLSRSLALGWERDIDDELLREDISWMVEGSPAHRLGNVLRVAERLRGLEERRKEKELKDAKLVEAERNKVALQKWKRLRTYLITLIFCLVLFTGMVLREASRANREADRAQREFQAAKGVTDFLTNLFEIAGPGDVRGTTITAKEILDSGAEKIKSELKDQPGTQARMMKVIGSVYQHLGLYDQAGLLLNESLVIQRQIHGPTSIEITENLNLLANLELDKGHSEKAESLFQEALDIIHASPRKSLLKESEILSGLGRAQINMGKYEEAAEFLNQALNMKKKELGVDHHDLAESLTALAEVYWLQARHDKAEPLLADALRLQLMHLGENHYQVASAYNNMAAVFREQGRYSDAIPLYETALNIFENVLEADHPDLASVLNNMATVYNDNGEYEPAGPLFERALAIRRKAYDHDHPLVAVSLNNLAWHHYLQGEYDIAESLNREALAIREKTLGLDHRDVALSLNNIALILMKKEDFHDAMNLLQRSITIREKAIGIDHPDYADSMSDMGRCLYLTGDAEKAVPYLEKALKVFELTQQKRNQKEMIDTATILETALISLGRLQEAEKLSKRIKSLR